VSPLRLRVATHDLALKRPYAWAKGEHTERRILLAQIEDSEGRSGWGEAAPPPHETHAPQDLIDTARILWSRLDTKDTQTLAASLQSVDDAPRLRAALIGACLDLQAQEAGLPLAKHLAPDRTIRRHVGVNALATAREPQALAQEAIAARHAGYRVLKIKSHGDPRHDALRLKAVRDAVGDRLRLRLDANESWPAEGLLARIQALKTLDIDYIEQPLPARDLDGLATLSRKSPIPIALDESVTDANILKWLLKHRVGAAIIIKPQRVAGDDRAIQMMALTRAHDVPAAITNSLESAVGRQHALHVAATQDDDAPDAGLATDDLIVRDVSQQYPRVHDGRIDVPTTAGLGLGMTPLKTQATRGGD
jgi:L-Ala-D/L-Glu epimerase